MCLRYRCMRPGCEFRYLLRETCAYSHLAGCTTHVWWELSNDAHGVCKLSLSGSEFTVDFGDGLRHDSTYKRSVLVQVYPTYKWKNTHPPRLYPRLCCPYSEQGHASAFLVFPARWRRKSPDLMVSRIYACPESADQTRILCAASCKRGMSVPLPNGTEGQVDLP